MEYEEIIGQELGSEISSNVLILLENTPNVKWVTNYFKWNLVKADADDNKFVDCAVACNAKFLVSDDNHFKVLKDISFPKIEVLQAKEFIDQIKN